MPHLSREGGVTVLAQAALAFLFPLSYLTVQMQLLDTVLTDWHYFFTLLPLNTFLTFKTMLFVFQKFNVAEEKRISQEIELQSYLSNLIIEEKKR